MWNPRGRRNRKPLVNVPIPVGHQSPLPIVADGAIARVDVGDGRLLAALVVDIRERADLKAVFAAHEAYSQGEVTSVWARPPEQEFVVLLVLKWLRPVETWAILEFPLPTYGGIVDQIVATSGLCLFDSDGGETVGEQVMIGRPQIIAEVSSDFPEWDDIFQRSLEEEAIDRGVDPETARGDAEKFRREWRRSFGGKGLEDW